MKEEDIIQAANEYVGHAEEAEEDLSTYRNRKSFEAGAKWMQEKIIDEACEWLSNMSIEDMIEKYDEFDTSEGWYKFIDDLKKVMKQ